MSNQLVKTHALLVLEDLNITGMTKNRRLSRVISDAAWGELARQVTYKQAWRGGHVVVADRWFPSSKTCSTCGTLRKGLTLKDRTFECHGCGAWCCPGRGTVKQPAPSKTPTDRTPPPTATSDVVVVRDWMT